MQFEQNGAERHQHNNDIGQKLHGCGPENEDGRVLLLTPLAGCRSGFPPLTPVLSWCSLSINGAKSADRGNAMKLATATLAFALSSFAAAAADYPAPKQGDWVARDFKFHTAEVLPELRLHYTTIGEPSGQPVLLLHGTGGSAAAMLTPAFAGELFGAGQPLDAAKYYIILADAVGHGKSSKPSDGLKTKFPKYNYADMVDAQHRLLAEGLGIKHVRLVIGNSMGGMETWLWVEKFPGFMDAAVPMASQPTAMAARNWMLRRMMLELIRQDPEYNNGDYAKQPHSLKLASVFFGIATSGGTLNYQKQAPTGATRRQGRRCPARFAEAGRRQ